MLRHLSVKVRIFRETPQPPPYGCVGNPPQGTIAVESHTEKQKRRLAAPFSPT